MSHEMLIITNSKINVQHKRMSIANKRIDKRTVNKRLVVVTAGKIIEPGRHSRKPDSEIDYIQKQVLQP